MLPYHGFGLALAVTLTSRSLIWHCHFCRTCALAALARGAALRDSPTEGESEGALASTTAAAKRTDS